jgi:CMP-N,N'-diacetyllegionaminic acid synthase
MYLNKKILAIIPARGGSKGIIKKNIKDVARKPLIAWTILEAKKSKYIDRVILSSDDLEIIETAKKWGCDVPFIRPSELAQDDTPRNPPIHHALGQLSGYDYVVLLQPTAPMRTVFDIDGCIKFCFENKAKACVSVVEQEPSPYWMFKLEQNYKMNPLMGKWTFTRRQDLAKIFSLNGAIYFAENAFFQSCEEEDAFLTEETVGYVMPKSRSLDIDTEDDMKLCEVLLKQRQLTEQSTIGNT